ncbi:hypothetical protein BC828DRAFT_133392 [Blastocladiella britannica]|nr:hypothetical protein BC828DRAFT_133392 [Blastocladiella britannica]
MMARIPPIPRCCCCCDRPSGGTVFADRFSHLKLLKYAILQAYECPSNIQCDPHIATKRRAIGKNSCLYCYNATSRAYKRVLRRQLLETDSNAPTFQCRGLDDSDPHPADTKRRAKGQYYCTDCFNAYRCARYQLLPKMDGSAQAYDCPGNSACDPHVATRRRAKDHPYCLDCANDYRRALFQKLPESERVVLSKRKAERRCI